MILIKLVPVVALERLQAKSVTGIMIAAVTIEHIEPHKAVFSLFLVSVAANERFIYSKVLKT
jgi:hypothetical protein